MELGDALARRRSCRSFDGRPVQAHLIERVVGAATRAPTAGNSWALDVLALHTPDAVAAYWDVTLPPERRAAFPWPGLLRAPVLLVPTVRDAAYVERYARADKAGTGLGRSVAEWPVPYWWVDAGAAVMAMLLAATDLGLGSLLFGAFDHEPAVCERFAIPPDRRLVGAVAMGWPDGGDRPSMSAKRSRPAVDEFIHHGSW